MCVREWEKRPPNSSKDKEKVPRELAVHRCRRRRGTVLEETLLRTYVKQHNRSPPFGSIRKSFGCGLFLLYSDGQPDIPYRKGGGGGGST